MLNSLTVVGHWPLPLTLLPCRSKPHLLCLLDGLATGVRRCMQGTYMLHVRVPCGGMALPQVHPAPAAPGTPQAVGAGPYAGGLPRPVMPPAGAGWAASLPPPHHVAAVAVPQLRQQDIQGALPGEPELGNWHGMGSLMAPGG